MSTVVLRLWNSSATALIDARDAELVAPYRWRLATVKSKHHYVRATVDGVSTLLHRFLMKPSAAEVVDHKNGNGLDCRRENMRVTTPAMNARNVVRGAWPGVHRVKTGWIVRFRGDGKLHYFGHFKDENEAKAVAKAAALQVHGEFSPYWRLAVAAPHEGDASAANECGSAEAIAITAAAKRLVAFMRVTHSLAPLQWMAEQMGCDVVMRDTRAAEVAALKERLRELGKAA